MSNERPNPEYNPTISLDKGITNAKSAGIGGALTTLLLVGVTLAQGGKLDEVAATGVVSAVVALGAAAVAGLGEWWRNRKKHSKVRRTGRLPVVLLIASLALGGALSGCETVTDRDGTVTQSVDTEGLLDTVNVAFTTWERLETLRQTLAAEREAAKTANNAEAMARLDAQLEAIAPELQAAREAVHKNPMLLRILGTYRAQPEKAPSK